MKRILAQSTIQKYAKATATVLGLSLFTLAALFFIEGVPARFATPETQAWHCESMTASPASITAGEQSTLTWHFAADTGITVTIDELAGQTWDGVSGSTAVSPTTSMTYTARAHKVGDTQTLTCSVHVTVTTPPSPEPVAPTCPYTSDANTTVFEFDGTRIVSSATLDKSRTGVSPVSLTAGTYTIRTASWDGYNARTTVTQPNESWYVSFLSGNTEQSKTDTTTDIADFVRENLVQETLEESFVLNGAIDAIRAAHAVYPDATSPNSVVPICVAFTKHTPPPVEEPEWPACPFTADANTIVVSFDGKGLIANGSESDARSSVYAVSLPAATYTLKSASWDGYSWRAGDGVQPYEQWVLAVRDAEGTLFTSSATTDLDDEVISSLKTDTLSDNMVLTRAATLVQATHAKYWYESRQSVQPVCVAFVKHEEPQYDPWCSMGASPSAIDAGGSTTLWWDSNDMTSMTIANYAGGRGGLAVSGSTVVSPTVTTTYTGTFIAKDNTTHTCNATVTVNTPSADPTPTCSMSVSDTSVARDSEVILTWSSDNATNATIDQGIGSVSVNGDKTVTVSSNTTYTGTFTSSKGKTVTCSVAVSTRTGGGGSCLNCKDKPKDKPVDKPKDVDEDDDDPSPKIILSKTITKTGGYIGLDQIPYTGFEAGPMLTMFFWLTVLGLSAAIAYVMTYLHPIARIRNLLAANAVTRAHRAREDYVANAVDQTRASMNADVGLGSYNSLTLSLAASDGTSQIETRAQADNILLSPEAVRMIREIITRIGANEDVLLNELFGVAKDTYPREDGWILLSRERTQTLLAHYDATSATDAAIPAAANAPTPAPLSSNHERPIRNTPPVLGSDRPAIATSEVRAPMNTGAQVAPKDENEALAEFVSYLIAGEQQKTFDVLRNMTGKGIGAENFIAQLVRKLDDIYKNRLEGNHNPDPLLAAKTATWSNGDFEKVLGILVECIDYSYSSTRIGTKVALAKAFEYFAQKNK